MISTFSRRCIARIYCITTLAMSFHVLSTGLVPHVLSAHLAHGLETWPLCHREIDNMALKPIQSQGASTGSPAETVPINKMARKEFAMCLLIFIIPNPWDLQHMSYYILHMYIYIYIIYITLWDATKQFRLSTRIGLLALDPQNTLAMQPKGHPNGILPWWGACGKGSGNSPGPRSVRVPF